MTLWLSQWQCANKHDAMAIPWDDNLNNRESVTRQGEEIFTSGQLKRICGLCGLGLAAKHTVMPFRTMEEATVLIRQLERENAEARARIGNRF